MKTNYDVIIIGAGPAGLTAALYCARYKLDCIVISKTAGGAASTAYKICNYPSSAEIKGYELMEKYRKQVEELKVPIIYDDIIKIEKNKDDKEFSVLTDEKKFRGKKIIFCIGTERIRLNVIGEGKFLGRGVSYCTTCDAAFFKNKTTAVVGGSNAALTSALLLAEYSHKVYIIYRGKKFIKPDPVWIELIEKEKKIQVIFEEDVNEIIGNKSVEGIKLSSGKILKVEGVFVEAGSVPNTKIISNLKINHDEKGYVIVNKKQETNVKGFFAAGDITNNILKQIVTASGEGAIAAYSAYSEIKYEEG